MKNILVLILVAFVVTSCNTKNKEQELSDAFPSKQEYLAHVFVENVNKYFDYIGFLDGAKKRSIADSIEIAQEITEDPDLTLIEKIKVEKRLVGNRKSVSYYEQEIISLKKYILENKKIYEDSAFLSSLSESYLNMIGELEPLIRKEFKEGPVEPNN